MECKCQERGCLYYFQSLSDYLGDPKEGLHFMNGVELSGVESK